MLSGGLWRRSGGSVRVGQHASSGEVELMSQDVRSGISVICYGFAVAIGGGFLVMIGVANQPEGPFESSRGADLVQTAGGAVVFLAVVMVVAGLVRIGRALVRQESDASR